MGRGPAPSVRGLTKSFGDRTVARGLEVAKGTIFALVVESGSGKPTTARIILGLEDADSGSVTIVGQEALGLTGNACRDLWR